MQKINLKKKIQIKICQFPTLSSHVVPQNFGFMQILSARPTLIVGFPLAQYDPSFIVLAIIIIRTELRCNLLNVFIDVLQLKLESQLIYILINVTT